MVALYVPSGCKAITGMRSATVLTPPCRSANVFPSSRRLPAIRTGAPWTSLGALTTNVIRTSRAAGTWISTIVLSPGATVAPCWNVSYVPSMEYATEIVRSGDESRELESARRI